MNILWLVIFIMWILWTVGYPIYSKVKGKSVFGIGSLYSNVMCIIALLLCIAQILKMV